MDDTLKNIDKELKDNFSDVFDSLNPGTTDEQLVILAECFSSEDLPEEIIKLYKWHNGQSGNYSLNQEDNRTFLPLEEVVDS